MKQTKSKTHSAKYSAKAHRNAKHHTRDRRPLHRTIAFHPINLLFLLCVGVLLSASSIGAIAASYSVNGEILAPIPTDPAVITSPSNNQQLSPQTQTISGTCPTDTYVEVSDNATLLGIAICDQSGTFQVSAALTSGLNMLTAQDYNVTNNPGPSSSSVSVYYFPPTPPSTPTTTPPTPLSTTNTPAYVAPVTVKVLQIDTDIPFESPSQTQLVSYGPTFTGIAPPNSLIVITIHTNPYYCHTYANAQGYWSCTFNQVIPPGLHTVYITAQTPSKQIINLPPFHLKVTAAPPKQQTKSSKLSISTDYTYKVYELNKPVTLNLQIHGGTQPYALTVTWGDGVISTYVEQTDANFSITHTYKHLETSLGSIPVKIAAVDTKGDLSSLQVAVILRNPSYAATTSNTHPPSSSIVARVRPWLTVLWPGYVVVLLMIFSFWLGERQETIALLNREKLQKRTQRRHSHSH